METESRFVNEGDLAIASSEALPETSIIVGGVEMLILPSGPLQAEAQHDRTLVTVTLDNQLSHLALNSDKSRDVITPMNSIEFIPGGASFKLETNNLSPVCLLAIEPDVMEKQALEMGMSPDFERYAAQYPVDHVAGAMARSAVAYMGSRRPHQPHIDSLTAEAFVSGILSRFFAWTQSADGDTDAAVSNWISLKDETRLQRAVDFAQSKITDPTLRTSEMAEVACLSNCHFSTVFKKWKGESPYAYIIKERLKIVRHSVANSRMPLSEVAYSTGFSSQSHMTSAFTKHYGISPARLRAN